MTTSKVTFREFGRLTPVHPHGVVSPVMPPIPAEPRPIERPRVPMRLRERVKTRNGHVDLLLFRVGAELFALELIEVEEALDLPELNPLPEMEHGMVGVFSLRETLLPAYAPDEVIGVQPESLSTVLVLRGRDRRLALAVDDVEDVATVALSELRDAPVAEGDGLMLGVFRHGARLVALLDADTLLSACRSEGLTENA